MHLQTALLESPIPIDSNLLDTGLTTTSQIPYNHVLSSAHNRDLSTQEAVTTLGNLAQHWERLLFSTGTC
jgi:hypothetical protein